jgi:hypothetical protein
MLQAIPRSPSPKIKRIVFAHPCQPPSGQHLESDEN